MSARVDMGPYEFGIGDYDCDRMVDLLDFAHWIDCMTGPRMDHQRHHSPCVCGILSPASG